MGSDQSIVDSYPLSPIQQGMLFHYMSGAHSGVDIEQIVCRFEEVLDPATFAEAWQAVARQHASLRTAFRWDGLEQPLQDVYAEVRLPFAAVDWRDEQNADAQLNSFLAEDRAAGFDLEVPPLARLTLFQTADEHFTLVWTFHHMLMDGRSFPLILRDVFTAYAALSNGAAVTLADIPAYGQHIQWLSDRDASGDEAFWKTLLAGVSGPTPLPVATQSDEHAGAIERAELEVRLSSELTAALKVI